MRRWTCKARGRRRALCRRRRRAAERRRPSRRSEPSGHASQSTTAFLRAVGSAWPLPRRMSPASGRHAGLAPKRTSPCAAPSARAGTRAEPAPPRQRREPLVAEPATPPDRRFATAARGTERMRRASSPASGRAPVHRRIDAFAVSTIAVNARCRRPCGANASRRCARARAASAERACAPPRQRRCQRPSAGPARRSRGGTPTRAGSPRSAAAVAATARPVRSPTAAPAACRRVLPAPCWPRSLLRAASARARSATCSPRAARPAAGAGRRCASCWLQAGGAAADRRHHDRGSASTREGRQPYRLSFTLAQQRARAAGDAGAGADVDRHAGRAVVRRVLMPAEFGAPRRAAAPGGARGLAAARARRRRRRRSPPVAGYRVLAFYP